MLDEKTRELIAIGATVTANCQSCLEYHSGKASEFGASPAEIQAAVDTGKEVRRGAASKMDRYAAGLSSPASGSAGGCGCM